MSESGPLNLIYRYTEAEKGRSFENHALYDRSQTEFQHGLHGLMWSEKGRRNNVPRRRGRTGRLNKEILYGKEKKFSSYALYGWEKFPKLSRESAFQRARPAEKSKEVVSSPCVAGIIITRSCVPLQAAPDILTVVCRECRTLAEWPKRPIT